MKIKFCLLTLQSLQGKLQNTSALVLTLSSDRFGHMKFFRLRCKCLWRKINIPFPCRFIWFLFFFFWSCKILEVFYIVIISLHLDLFLVNIPLDFKVPNSIEKKSGSVVCDKLTMTSKKFKTMLLLLIVLISWDFLSWFWLGIIR